MKIFDPNEFGIEHNRLYEILATTFVKDETRKEIEPNTSCMGIRLIDGDLISIIPFPNSNTFKNLKANGFISINFVNNVYLYYLAALKDPDSQLGVDRFPMEMYEYRDLTMEKKENSERCIYIIPHVKSAWGVLVGKAIKERPKLRKDKFGEINLTEFSIKILDYERFKNSYKLFNRAENLTLECIIIATRMKVAKKMNDKEALKNYLSRFNMMAENVMRFSVDENIIKTLMLVKEHVKAYRH